MAKENIILTGFMATGKTTVGKKLAEHLGYPFLDTDEIIAERAGMSVSEIFKQQGEAAFRRMEAELARELGNRAKLVVSTGGRMVLDPANAEALSRKGRIFCLVATLEEIYCRVSKDKRVKRPLLEVANPMQRIADLLEERKEAYGRFPQIDTSEKTADEVIQNLIGILKADPDFHLRKTN